MDAGHEQRLERHGDVADTRRPRAIGTAGHAEGKRDFELLPAQEALLVDQPAVDVAWAARGAPAAQHELVLDECLLGHLRAREIQIAAGPDGIHAEAAQVIQHGLLLGFG